MKPNISYFHVFESKCFIHNNGKGRLKAFDAKSNKEVFLEYSGVSKVLRVFNKRTLVVEETSYIVFEEPSSNREAADAIAKKLE